MSNVNLFEALPTRANSSALAKQIADQVTEGNISPIKMAVKLSFMENTILEAKKNIKESFINDVYKYSKGESISSLGAKIEQAEVGVSYNYEDCGHMEYDLICRKKKEIEAFLKALKEPMTIVDEESGEITKIYPPVRRSTSSAKITLGK
jgi:hypothetical protein